MIAHLSKQRFGKRTEKVSKDQLSLFAKSTSAVAERTPKDEFGNSEVENDKGRIEAMKEILRSAAAV